MKNLNSFIGPETSIAALCAVFLFLAWSCNSERSGESVKNTSNPSSNNYTLASYYFPNYHPDARNIRRYGYAWTEWELVKQARPRFEGHMQPKVPQWGYTDESDPDQMARKIEAANEHGLDAFIFGWHYYDDGPFLEAAIEKGFLCAPNNHLMKFGLMWANHDWKEVFPADSGEIMKEGGPDLLYPGKITPSNWDKMTDYVIQTYFLHPSYWLIDEAPYFSVYDLTNFLNIFESVEAARKGVDLFRKKVKAAGFKDLHLNAVVWSWVELPSGKTVPGEELAEILEEIGFSSTTSYIWVHHVTPDFPTASYNDVKRKYFEYAARFDSETDLPYFPNVTMGWDCSPRTRQDKPYRKLKYPYMGIIVDNTPENFKNALVDMRKYLEEHPDSQKIFTINCWNEWADGSYLEPDTVHRMAYLEAIDEVF